MIANYFTVLMLCIAVGAVIAWLGDKPVEIWTRPCKWCFWTAIALIIGALGFPGWYLLYCIL